MNYDYYHLLFFFFFFLKSDLYIAIFAPVFMTDWWIKRKKKSFAKRSFQVLSKTMSKALYS